MLRVYSYCKHFYLQGQVYQHSRQLKSVIIYLRVFECRSVALAEKEPSEGCKTTAKASVRHCHCWSHMIHYICSLLHERKMSWFVKWLQFSNHYSKFVTLYILDYGFGTYIQTGHPQNFCISVKKLGHSIVFLWKCKMHNWHSCLQSYTNLLPC